MTVTTPPRTPRSDDSVTHDEFEALVEALIEEARQRQRRRRRKYAAVVTVVAIAGLAVANIVGGAAPSQTAAPAVASNSGAVAAKQRITIQAKGPSGDSTGAGTFVLTVLGPGALKSDSGTETSTWTVRNVIRQGQDVKLVTWLNTLVGKRGTLVFRARLEHVSAGSGYEIAFGTWRVVRGTDQYAGVTGGGRVANVWRIRDVWTERREGVLSHS